MGKHANVRINKNIMLRAMEDAAKPEKPGEDELVADMRRLRREDISKFGSIYTQQQRDWTQRKMAAQKRKAEIAGPDTGTERCTLLAQQLLEEWGQADVVVGTSSERSG